MSSEVKRKKAENFEAFFRRFNKIMMQSGRVKQAKKIRFHTRSANKNKLRESALRRSEIQKRITYLRKIGKAVEEDIRR